MKLIKLYGAKQENCFSCDTKGVIYPGRKEGMNPFKLTIANDTITKDTTFEEIAKDADVLIGVSKANSFTEDIVKGLAKDPVIFAMANPNPECVPP